MFCFKSVRCILQKPISRCAVRGAVATRTLITRGQRPECRKSARDQRHGWLVQRRASSDGGMPRLSKKGPISWWSLAVLLVAGGGVVLYVQKIKKEKELALEKQRTRSYGKAALGGPFSLTDHNGQPKTDKDFLGQWILIYFGFTFCPDICPDELHKLATVLQNLDGIQGVPTLYPLFITVDPDRDKPAVLKEYLKEFHPRILGLTGTSEQVHQATKAYRVYYSAGPVDDDEEYLVDHTIIMYLVDPKGEFVQYYGQNRTAPEMVADIVTQILNYEKSRS